MNNIKLIFTFLMLFIIINCVFLKKNYRISKRSEYMSRMLSKFSSMINHEILKNKYVKNLLAKNVRPATNDNDNLLLIKSLIAGVLKTLNVPDDKIDVNFSTLSKDDALKIMRILIKFHKTTSHVDVLKELGKFKIDGLDVSQISPGLAMNVTDYLAKFIRLQGRR